MKSLTRIQKLLALAASAALIGSTGEAQAAITRAMAIAADHGIDLIPLARAAGVELPRPEPKREIETGVYEGRHYTFTRTISADGRIELVTLSDRGRTEAYMDEDGSGLRSFVGYMDEISPDEYEQFKPLARIHWRTHDRYWAAK